MISFNKIVNILGKKCGKVILKSDIFEIIDPEMKDKYKNYLDKTTHRLKSEGIIITIKAGVYIVPSDDDLELNKVDLVDKYYFKLLKKYITFYCGNHYYISAKKSLEIHLKNTEVLDKIFIINRDLNKKIKVGNYEIIFKTISSKVNNKKINLYSKLSKFVVKKDIEGLYFKISSLELSLVESALISGDLGVDISLLNKAIKKYSKVFDKDIFYKIGELKFIMSFNRLKEISRHIDKDLYKVFLDIIKKNGGLFIGESLRGGF